MKYTFILCAGVILAAGMGVGPLASVQAEDSDVVFEFLPVEQVDWEQLNPARGDKSPQAGTLWGDRKGSPATGFLAKFVDGFPHHRTFITSVIARW